MVTLLFTFFYISQNKPIRALYVFLVQLPKRYRTVHANDENTRFDGTYLTKSY